MRVEQNDVLAKITLDGALGISLALPYVGLVIMDGEDLAGAVAFNAFDRHNIEMTALVIKPWTTHCAREIARYTFDRLRVARVTCTTLATNFRAINRLIALGFEYEGTMKERFPQGDGLLFGLLASRQRLLRPSREHSPSPRSLRDRSRTDGLE